MLPFGTLGLVVAYPFPARDEDHAGRTNLGQEASVVTGTGVYCLIRVTSRVGGLLDALLDFGREVNGSGARYFPDIDLAGAFQLIAKGFYLIP